MRGRYAKPRQSQLWWRGDPSCLILRFTHGSSSKNLFLSIPVSRHGLDKRKTANETREGSTRREGRIDNAIGGGLHHWPLFESAICIYLGTFVRALRDSWGRRWGESGQRERERWENLFGERGKGWERSTSCYGTTLRFGWKKARGGKLWPVSSVHLDYLDDDSRINW